MKALILAAGRGSRLGTLTDDRPKCLVELGGDTILGHLLRNLDACGIASVTIAAGYRADLVPEHHARVVINHNFARTNMVSTMFCVRDLFERSNDDLLIAYGDCIYERRVIAETMASNGAIAVAVDTAWRRLWSLRMENPLDDAETLKIDDTGRVTELGGKPCQYEDIEAQYMGLFKIDREMLADLLATYWAMDRDKTYDGQDFDNMYMTSFLQHLIDSGWPVWAVPVTNGWLEIDTVSDLTTYENLLAKHDLGNICRIEPPSLLK